MFDDFFKFIRHTFFEDIPTVYPADIAAHDEQGNEVEGNDEDRKLLDGTWVYLPSSNVSAVRYDLKERRLDCEFLNGRYYSYIDVPADFFLEWVKAPSAGKFCWDRIRRPDAFQYVRYSFSPGTPPNKNKPNITVES